MPRNSSGTMTLPAPGVPFQSGTTVSSAQMNATLSDVATEISDSASRSGKGGFTAPVRVPDGSAAAPAVAFTSEIASGLYRAGANDVRLAVGGVDALKLVAGGVNGPLVFPTGTTAVQVTLAGGFLVLQGNCAAADASNADVQLSSTATRTAGPIVSVQNPVGTSKLFIDWQGLLRLATQATAIQPTSIWTAITPDAGVTASGGLGYTKDAIGKVHVRGGITNNTGGNIFNINGANPLPAGFRPLSNRVFATPAGNVQVAPTGVISFLVASPAGSVTWLDVVSFFAEQ